jgi:large subunit ribosomal protein L23
MSIFDRFRKKQTKQRLETMGKATRPASASSDHAKRNEKTTKPKETGKEKKAPARKTLSEIASRMLLTPLVTEKVSLQGNLYAFSVHPAANKATIRRAITELYGVRPLGIRIQNRRGKPVRYGRHEGTTKRWKKAIVAFAEGVTLSSSEGR